MYDLYVTAVYDEDRMVCYFVSDIHKVMTAFMLVVFVLV